MTINLHLLHFLFEFLSSLLFILLLVLFTTQGKQRTSVRRPFTCHLITRTSSHLLKILSSLVRTDESSSFFPAVNNNARCVNALHRQFICTYHGARFHPASTNSIYCAPRKVWLLQWMRVLGGCVCSSCRCVNASQSAAEGRAAALPRLVAGLRRQASVHSGQRKNHVSRTSCEREALQCDAHRVAAETRQKTAGLPTEC